MNPLFNHIHLKELRRRLRRDQTYAEMVMWSQLRAHRPGGYKFYRQFSVGPYVLDFFCAHCNLAVELDGYHHFTEEGRLHDARRTKYLNEQGIRVIRFTNEEFLADPNGTTRSILAALAEAEE
ncbi:MAG TPA: endonuclease domain-containing protein [Candidatus Kapabacteria bacterium]|nr:endonuclease domain-containing protein [Candidatus Kapabacteria bacterium]